MPKAQGTLQKKCQKDCKIWRIGEFAVRLSLSNVSTHRVSPTWLDCINIYWTRTIDGQSSRWLAILIIMSFTWKQHRCFINSSGDELFSVLCDTVQQNLVNVFFREKLKRKGKKLRAVQRAMLYPYACHAHFASGLFSELCVFCKFIYSTSHLT